jgi:putative tricarboxylic transport membrane protein
MDAVLLAFEHTLSWSALFAALTGSVVGLIFGAIPGMTYTMALAIVLPMTFGMGPIPAIAMLLSTFIGGATGGTVSAILIGVPGTPSAAATVADGFALGKQGKASLAIGTATIVSTIGGLISLGIMLISVEGLARVALAFGPAEITALVIFGLSTICGLSERSLLRGLIAGVLGLMIMCIGQDPIDGVHRFTFGSTYMLQGVELLVAMIGLFAIPQVIDMLMLWKKGLHIEIDGSSLKTELPTLRLLLDHRWNILRSTVIGTVVGAIPGTNGAIAAFLAYDQEKRFSKHPERLGKGDIGGVIAPETANNALTGGAMIPLLGLGIPADPAIAIILGGLMIQGIAPGPLLLSSQPEIVYSIYVLFGISYILVTVILLFGLRAFVRALLIPPQIMALCILVMCVVGSFAIRNTLFDVGAMMAVGLIGYVLMKVRIPVTPVILGLILGPILERESRTAMVMSEGDLSIFYTSVPSALFLCLAVVVIGLHAVSSWRGSRKPVAQEA